MLGHSLGRNCKVTLINTGEVAGYGDTITSDEIDMAGYEGCLFLVHMGTISGSAATTCYVNQAATTGGSEARLEGTRITIAEGDDDEIQLMDVYRPEEQFLEVEVTRATANSVIQSIVAIQYGSRKPPVTHDSSTVANATYVAGPDEA